MCRKSGRRAPLAQSGPGGGSGRNHGRAVLTQPVCTSTFKMLVVISPKYLRLDQIALHSLTRTYLDHVFSAAHVHRENLQTDFA